MLLILSSEALEKVTYFLKLFLYTLSCNNRFVREHSGGPTHPTRTTKNPSEHFDPDLFQNYPHFLKTWLIFELAYTHMKKRHHYYDHSWGNNVQFKIFLNQAEFKKTHKKTTKTEHAQKSKEKQQEAFQWQERGEEGFNQSSLMSNQTAKIEASGASRRRPSWKVHSSCVSVRVSVRACVRWKRRQTS